MLWKLTKVIQSGGTSSAGNRSIPWISAPGSPKASQEVRLGISIFAFSVGGSRCGRAKSTSGAPDWVV